MNELVLGVAVAFLLALAVAIAMDAHLRIAEWRRRSRELAEMLVWFRRNEANLDQLLEFRRKMRAPALVPVARPSVHANNNPDQTIPYLVPRVAAKTLCDSAPK